MGINTPDVERKVEILCGNYLKSFNNNYRDFRALNTRGRVEGRRQLRLPIPQNNSFAKSYHYLGKKWCNEQPTSMH